MPSRGGSSVHRWGERQHCLSSFHDFFSPLDSFRLLNFPCTSGHFPRSYIFVTVDAKMKLSARSTVVTCCGVLCSLSLLIFFFFFFSGDTLSL